MHSEPPARDLADALNWVPGALDLPRAGRASVPADLPPTYIDLVALIGAGEGFVGHEYLRLFALDQLLWVNDAYGVGTYLPGHCMFGSNGCGEAYLFGPPTVAERAVIRVSFIPLDPDYVSQSWPSFDQFLLALVNAPPDNPDDPYPYTPDPDAIGKELHEVHPIALGGSPTDPANKVLVPVEKHAELVAFWNRTFNAIRQRAGA